MAIAEMPDAHYLRKVLAYNPETGEIIWRDRPQCHFKTVTVFKAWNIKYAGKPAGHIKQRYPTIRLDGRTLLTHRLIWVYVTGNWPVATLDHIDRNRFNNTWNNLREATHSQQIMNTGMGKNNTTGFKGVYAVERGRWRATIMLQGKKISLGGFGTREAAHTAYEAARKRYFEGFA